MQKHWIGVASADHVERGQAGGFMQVCHGKKAPLARVKQGDGIVYYSPTLAFLSNGTLQAFTAIGYAQDQPLYQVDMGGGFIPFRRNVDWLPALPTPIRPLLDRLDLTRGVQNWGYGFRFGLLGITCCDFETIAKAMSADLPTTVASGQYSS